MLCGVANDVGQGCYGAMKVRDAFANAYRELRDAVLPQYQHVQAQCSSFLGRILLVPVEVLKYRQVIQKSWQLRPASSASSSSSSSSMSSVADDAACELVSASTALEHHATTALDQHHASTTEVITSDTATVTVTAADAAAAAAGAAGVRSFTHIADDKSVPLRSYTHTATIELSSQRNVTVIN